MNEEEYQRLSEWLEPIFAAQPTIEQKAAKLHRIVMAGNRAGKTELLLSDWYYKYWSKRKVRRRKRMALKRKRGWV